MHIESIIPWQRGVASYYIAFRNGTDYKGVSAAIAELMERIDFKIMLASPKNELQFDFFLKHRLDLF